MPLHVRAAFLLILSMAGIRPARAGEATLPPPVHAARTTRPIVVDGLLDEEAWQRPGRSEFSQRDPIDGAVPSQKTDVWVSYDDEALYVAAQLHDTAPDSIVARLGRRDAQPASDWFYVAVDSYFDKRTAFYFGVNAAGCLEDGTFYNDESNDRTWDGVWDVAARVHDRGWSVEMRIPYSQLRFPKQEEYVWGVNFMRWIQRHNEEDWFSRTPKTENGGVSRFAELHGIRGIDPPQTLEIVPYVAGSLNLEEATPGDPFHDGTETDANLGADLRLGLGTNMTLNATVNPDFGQVEVDPAVVNLTQYETFFDEKRPFFVQGSSFFDYGSGGVNDNWGFNWGNPDFLYTRRIGRAPQGGVQHEGYVDMPQRTTIIGAGKITGRIGDEWTSGVLQAVTAREWATTDSAGVRFRDVVEPLTSYTTVRMLREFDRGARALGLIGTAVVRDLTQEGLAPSFTRSALTLGMDGWTNLDPAREWVVSIWGAGTHVTGTPERMVTVQRSSLRYYQRPDEPRLGVDSSATSLSGFGGRVAVNKQKGNWKFNAALGTLSPGFEVNDQGFSFRTDKINGHVVSGYQWFEPDGVFRSKGFRLAYSQDYEYSGRRTDEGVFLFTNAKLMNYLSFDAIVFHKFETWDSRRTRGGVGMLSPSVWNVNAGMRTDEREPLVGEVELSVERSASTGSGVFAEVELAWKPAAGVHLSFAPSYYRGTGKAQWVQNTPDPAATRTYGTRHVFSTIDQQELAASIRADWTFTPVLTFQLYMQPLISVGSYSGFKELARPGSFDFLEYGREGSTIAETGGGYEVDPDGPGPAGQFFIPDPDFNFKSLRVNAVLRWEYLPGSTLYLVWTRSHESLSDPGDFNPGRDLGTLLADRADTAFLLKIAYWLNP